MSYSASTKTIAFGLFVLVLVLFALPAVGLKMGTVAIQPGNTVTVSGYATSEQKNQVAVFSAGVTKTDLDRTVAVNGVNETVDMLIKQLKEFGIPEEDLKTQNLSLYQIEEPLFQEGRTAPSKNSVWQANNTVEVKLRDVNKSSELTTLLTSSGATNVYGPTFQLDVAGNPEDALIADAIENAREKATQIAQSSGQRLGSIVTVSEGSSGGGVYPMMASFRDAAMSSGGAMVEPGTSTISKSMTVTFTLRPSWWPF